MPVASSRRSRARCSASFSGCSSGLFSASSSSSLSPAAAAAAAAPLARAAAPLPSCAGRCGRGDWWWDQEWAVGGARVCGDCRWICMCKARDAVPGMQAVSHAKR